MSATPPPCYGKSWDPNDIVCKGGLNPAYKNPTDGSHKQPACGLYQSCAQQTCANKAQAQAQPPIAFQTLVRPLVVPAAPQAPPQVPPQASATPPWMPPNVAPPAPRPPNPFAMQVAQHVGHYAPQYMPQIAQVLVPPSIAQFGPQQVPMNYAMPGSQVPSYLTVPEPVLEGVPWYRRLAGELFRAALKSSCHQGASFFDHNPINQYPRQDGS